MNIIQSTFFYISIFIICTFFCRFANKKNNKKILIIPIIILTLVTGLRAYNVGADTLSYKTISDECYYNLNSLLCGSSRRMGFAIAVRTIYSIIHNYSILLLIEGLVINSLILLRFWDFRDKSSFSGMVFFYLLMIFISTFTNKCQYVAISIVFFSTRYIGKFNVKAFILILIASSIHLSGLIGFLYFIFRYFDFKNLTKRKLLINIVGLIIGCFITVVIFNSLTNGYNYYLKNKLSIGYMAFAKIFVYFFLKANSNFVFKESSIISKCFLLGIGLTTISYFFPAAGRIGFYFTIFDPVFYGLFLTNNKKTFIKSFVLLWCIFISVYSIYNSNIDSSYLYNFIWNS